MTWTIGHYKSASWPDETGDASNGGAIDLAEPLTGAPHEIFDPAVSSFGGGTAHEIYRKVWIRNENSATIEDASVFLHDAKYPGQITIAVEKGASDTSSNPWTIPSGYTGGDFVEADGSTGALAKTVGGADLDTGDSMGVWMRLYVPAGLREADPYVPVNLVLIGNRP